MWRHSTKLHCLAVEAALAMDRNNNNDYDRIGIIGVEKTTDQK